MSFNVGDDEKNVHQNRQIFYDAVKVSKNSIAFPRQVHSDIIKIIKEPGIYQDCDALITDQKNIYLAISVADCVPIFLYDKANKIVSAIHSGWQGSSKKIVTKTLDIMVSKLNTHPENIYAHIGYSAGVCCYEVGKDVADYFDTKFALPINSGKYLLDLKKFNRSLLLSSGIPDDQIETSEFCTICYPNFLHSYRRDGIKSGRMMGLIGMMK
jgi:YfiH family protein